MNDMMHFYDNISGFFVCSPSEGQYFWILRLLTFGRCAENAGKRPPSEGGPEGVPEGGPERGPEGEPGSGSEGASADRQEDGLEAMPEGGGY